MKILVLGASGMAGHTIAIYFKERGHDVFSFSTSPVNFCESIVGDASRETDIKDVISKYDFDVIINCIGLLNEIAEEKAAKAIYLNSYLPFYISELVKNIKTKFIHMSTDCVFAGNTGPYYEASVTDGKTFYDRTKALGELNNCKDLTFRNSIVGPDMKFEGIGLFNWFMKQKGPIKGFSKAIWTGVTTLTLAKAMDKAIEDNLTGLYNLVNNTSISKYELLNFFNKEFRDNQIQIIEENEFIIDKTLINTRTDFNFIVPSYEKMVFEMKEWVNTHPIFYTHYKFEK